MSPVLLVSSREGSRVTVSGGRSLCLYVLALGHTHTESYMRTYAHTHTYTHIDNITAAVQT